MGHGLKSKIIPLLPHILFPSPFLATPPRILFSPTLSLSLSLSLSRTHRVEFVRLASDNMFYLSLIEHNLPMPPRLLSRPLLDAIKEELDSLFLDKVIANLGLCISVYDIRSVEGGFVFPVSLGFFSDIYVPKHLLQQPCKRGPDGIWLWVYEGEELSLDVGEEIRFRVSNIKYPPIPAEQKEDAKPFAPMEIIGEISGDGLGLPSWWGD
ncbi:uncharacterized protein [Typha latifolia]|uniref:uncharacterized protein isoform X1 n=1 Tax=Typha latifolia TaxID=4733 RepID=UPI003C30A799